MLFELIQKVECFLSCSITMPKNFYIILLFPFALHGQEYLKNHFGATVGITANFGTHINAVGINLKGFYTDYFAQLNATSTFYFYRKGIGNRSKYWESRNSIGLVLLAGKKQMEVDFLLDGLNHQTKYNYGLGYNYVFYFDNAGTSQNSGGFAIHLKNFSVYNENDVFGGQAKDRFRTGHFYISYRKEDYKFGLGLNLWTGETANSKWDKTAMDKMPSGFRILEDLPHGRSSHGILYGAFTYNLPNAQYAHLKFGIDSEHIRHVIQNRIIHDLTFLPKGIERNTPHYPRLDENGCPVFNKTDTRKSKFYMQFGLNENWSN